MGDHNTAMKRALSQEEWTRRYKEYLGPLVAFTPQRLNKWAQAAWDSWSDDEPEEIASSDLYCLKGDE